MVNNITPLKTVRIKTTSSQLFDGEIAKKLSLGAKLLNKLKSSRVSIDWEIYKKEGNDVQGPIKYKKKIFRGNIGRNLSKTKIAKIIILESLELSNKKFRCQIYG